MENFIRHSLITDKMLGWVAEQMKPDEKLILATLPKSRFWSGSTAFFIFGGLFVVVIALSMLPVAAYATEGRWIKLLMTVMGLTIGGVIFLLPFLSMFRSRRTVFAVTDRHFVVANREQVYVATLKEFYRIVVEEKKSGAGYLRFEARGEARYLFLPFSAEGFFLSGETACLPDIKRVFQIIFDNCVISLRLHETFINESKIPERSLKFFNHYLNAGENLLWCSSMGKVTLLRVNLPTLIPCLLLFLIGLVVICQNPWNTGYGFILAIVLLWCMAFLGLLAPLLKFKPDLYAVTDQRVFAVARNPCRETVVTNYLPDRMEISDIIPGNQGRADLIMFTQYSRHTEDDSTLDQKGAIRTTVKDGLLGILDWEEARILISKLQNLYQ